MNCDESAIEDIMPILPHDTMVNSNKIIAINLYIIAGLNIEGLFM
jgi:hypothetical protein